MANEKETTKTEQQAPEATQESAPVEAPKAEEVAEQPKSTEVVPKEVVVEEKTPVSEEKVDETSQEVQEEPAETTAEVAAPVVAEEPEKVYKPTPSPLGSIVETAKKPVVQDDASTGIFAILKGKFEQYAVDMKPGKRMTTEQGAAKQASLYQTLVQVFKLPPQDFFKAWTDFLAVVFANAKGAFDEHYAYRFIADIKFLDQPQKNAFRNTLLLAISTADPNGRRVALKSLDITSAVKGFPVAGLIEKMQAFYDPQ